MHSGHCTEVPPNSYLYSATPAQVSLYQPTLRFGISSATPLSEEQWQEVWMIWERAIATGLGSRVSAGYGQIATGATGAASGSSAPVLYRARLKGQGQAPKLIDGTEEFRPNIFRAALRGHALRIFGGLADVATAERIVDDLFGGVRGHGTVGLLGLQFETQHLKLAPFGPQEYKQFTYEVEGEIAWLLMQPLPHPEQVEALRQLVTDLMWFAMLLGGFGKSWRRADHRLFYENSDYEKLIGCHWQWAGEVDRANALRVWKLDKVTSFIDSVRASARAWMQVQNIVPRPNYFADWREAWHPDQVQVWGRIAETQDHCRAIVWLHEPYQRKVLAREQEKTIKASSMTGKLNQIGRLWHRMYPPMVRLAPPATGKKTAQLKSTRRFLELLTVFPDGSSESEDFLDFLATHPEKFQLLWGGTPE